MKTFKGIRIVMMSVIALMVFSFASRAFAAVDAFIWFEDQVGAKTKVKINDDGSFTTPPLKAGTYSWSFGVSQTTVGSATGGAGSGKVQVHDISVTPPVSMNTMTGTPPPSSTPPPADMISGHSISSGGDRPQESVSFNFTKIEVKYSAQSSRDASSGMATGRRMHKPFVITKELDKASPLLTTALGTVVVDADGDSFSGIVVAKDNAGKRFLQILSPVRDDIFVAQGVSPGLTFVFRVGRRLRPDSPEGTTDYCGCKMCRPYGTLVPL